MNTIQISSGDGIIRGMRKGVSNWLRQFRVFVDPLKKMYKVQESLLGIFKWGEYEKLPPLDYVLVFKSFFAKCESCSIEEFENNPYSFYQVSLVSKNKRIIVHETEDKSEAFDLAVKMAGEFGLRVRDSATKRTESKWLN